MADRLLVDLGGDGGRVSVGMWVDGKLPAAGQPCELTWPLDHEALEDLRWYLEDYLRAPFGVWEDRSLRIEAALPGWGHAMFSAVFGAGLAPGCLQQGAGAAAPGGGGVPICVAVAAGAAVGADG